MIGRGYRYSKGYLACSKTVVNAMTGRLGCEGSSEMVGARRTAGRSAGEGGTVQSSEKVQVAGDEATPALGHTRELKGTEGAKRGPSEGACRSPFKRKLHSRPRELQLYSSEAVVGSTGCLAISGSERSGRKGTSSSHSFPPTCPPGTSGPLCGLGRNGTPHPPGAFSKSLRRNSDLRCPLGRLEGFTDFYRERDRRMLSVLPQLQLLDFQLSWNLLRFNTSSKSALSPPRKSHLRMLPGTSVGRPSIGEPLTRQLENRLSCSNMLTTSLPRLCRLSASKCSGETGWLRCDAISVAIWSGG